MGEYRRSRTAGWGKSSPRLISAATFFVAVVGKVVCSSPLALKTLTAWHNPLIALLPAPPDRVT